MVDKQYRTIEVHTADVITITNIISKRESILTSLFQFLIHRNAQNRYSKKHMNMIMIKCGISFLFFILL